MDIELKFNTKERVQEKLESADDITISDEQDKRIHALISELMSSRRFVPNKDKEKWFELIADAAIYHAEASFMDIKIWTTGTDDKRGMIRFETDSFSLVPSLATGFSRFWLYLCHKGNLAIEPRADKISMQFTFDLHDLVFDR